MFHFVTRLLSTSYTSTVQVQPLSAGRLHRDQFGFQKLLVAITTHGKLYAMDSASGNAIWTRMLSTSTEADQALEVVGLWRVREFGEQGNPLLSVVATRGTGETAETLAWTIDGFTGHITANGGQPKIVFSGSTKAAFLIPYENCSTKQQVLAIVSELTGDVSCLWQREVNYSNQISCKSTHTARKWQARLQRPHRPSSSPPQNAH